jgi:hypothetical protein
MRVITFGEIKKRCNREEVLKKERKIEALVKSEKNYSPGRKKPRSPIKKKSLDEFQRKL